MSEPGSLLKEIHRLMRHLHDLEGKIAGGPRALKSAQLALARHEENVRLAHESVKALKVKIHDKEVTIKASQQHITKLEQTSVSNKKEYDALRAEIAGLQKTIRAVEDEILDYMGGVEEKQGKLPDLDKAVVQAKAELTRIEAEHREMHGRYGLEKEKARAELTEIEKALPEKLLPTYQRLVASKGAQALSGVVNRICQACYTEIPLQMSNELTMGHFIQCKSCDRLLYQA